MKLCTFFSHSFKREESAMVSQTREGYQRVTFASCGVRVVCAYGKERESGTKNLTKKQKRELAVSGIGDLVQL